MNSPKELSIEEIRTRVKKGIEQGLDVVSNTQLGVNVTYSTDEPKVYTTLSELVISFTVMNFLFTCKIPLWRDRQYDLTLDGDALTSFNSYRFLEMETWIDATLMAQEDFQKWMSQGLINNLIEISQSQDKDINFAITIMHTKNRFSRVEGDEMWKYIDMPTPCTIKIIDPDDETELVGARLEIEYTGTDEIRMDKICENFRHQYLGNK